MLDRLGKTLAGNASTPWDEVDMAMFRVCINAVQGFTVAAPTGGDGLMSAAEWLDDDFRELYWRDDA